MKVVGPYRNLLLHPDESGDLVDDLILDESAVHVEDGKALMPTEHTLLLQDNLYVPLALETPNTLMFAEIRERKVLWVWRWREGDLEDARVFLPIETPM